MLLIVETITWKPHIETAIDIALQARDAGESVVYCNLRRGLPICEDRHASHALIDLPETRIRRSGELLEASGIRYLRPTYTTAERRAALVTAEALIAPYNDSRSLTQLRHPSFAELGWAILSSAISMTRDSQVAPTRHRKLFIRLCAAALLVHQRTIDLIDEHAATEILLFNGRFATTRAVLAAAEFRGIRWRMHERGRDWHHYWVADCLPQDLDRVQRLTRSCWRDEHAEIGHCFFTSRRDRVERAWHSFTHLQQRGRIPAEMQQPGEWVTYFSSSDDELAAIGDTFTSPGFPTQLDALKALAQAVAMIPGMRLCIRVHPHIAQKSSVEQRKWASIKIDGALLLGPEESSDSYALIERSRVVCTYGSTIGVEATYWRRPSLLFSRSYYDQLGVCTQASDVAQIRRFIENPSVAPIEGALAFGAFNELMGEPHVHYRPDHFHRGSICGVYLDDSLVVRLVKWLRRALTQ